MPGLLLSRHEFPHGLSQAIQLGQGFPFADRCCVNGAMALSMTDSTVLTISAQTSRFSPDKTRTAAH